MMWSTVFALGAELTGLAMYQKVQSIYFRAPKFKSMLKGEPAWMYLAFNPRCCGPTAHVAWHGDKEPDDAPALIDHLRGVPLARLASVAAE